MIAEKQKQHMYAYIPMLPAGMYQGLPQGSVAN